MESTLDNTLGPLEAGVLIALCFYGAIVVQSFTYYRTSWKSDRAHIRILVVWCTILETVHSVFICVYLHDVTVKHFGDAEFLNLPVWSLSYSVVIGTLVSAPVQIFFTYRVHGISRKRILPSIGVLLSVVRVGVTTVASTMAYQRRDLMAFGQEFMWLLALGMAIATVVDVGNTIGLCWCLVSNRSEMTGRSKKIIDTLIVWTIETGLLTSLCMVTALILVITMPNATAWLCPVMFTTKVYSNSLFASLNGRTVLREFQGPTSAFTLPSENDKMSGIRFKSETQDVHLDLSLTIREDGEV